MVIKFGKSSQIQIRDFEEHRRLLGNQFKIVYIGITNDNKKVEDTFKKLIRSKGVEMIDKIKNKKQTEIFVENKNFNLDKAIEEMEKIIKKYSTNELEYDIKFLEKHPTLWEKIEERKIKEAQVKIIEAETRKIEAIRDIKKMDPNFTFNEKNTNLIENKQEIIEENNDGGETMENEDIYQQFIKENIISNTKHIYCSILYKGFRQWYKNNNFTQDIPSNRTFIDNLKKYKEVLSVKVDGKAQLGIKLAKLRE